MGKDDFKYLSQEIESKVLDLVRKNGFYLYEYVSSFENFKERLPNKERFCCSLTSKIIGDIEHEHVLKVCNRFERKKIKDYDNLYLKCDLRNLEIVA